MTERGFQQVQCSTQYRSFCVRRLQGYRVVWQLQWTAKKADPSKAHNSRAGKGVVLNAEQKDGGLCMQIWMSDS
jgi:hypothetical protein